MNDKPNIVMPLAGLGVRFQNAGYSLPKPLIAINGKTIVQRAVDSIKIEGTFIFICLKEHIIKYNLDEYLSWLVPNCKIVPVDSVTDGAARTILLANYLINNESPLIISNCDQCYSYDHNLFLEKIENYDGCILTFKDTDPKWSFCEIRDTLVTRVAEKNPISNVANVGVFGLKHGYEFIKYAHQMINKDIRVNSEYFVSPVFNEFIQDGKRITTLRVNEFYGLGTPQDIIEFERLNKN